MCVNRASDKLVCPVDDLAVYMDHTEGNVPVNGPVFVALNNPSQFLSINLVSNIFNHAIQLARLGDRGYSAKNFRPTVATAVVEANLDPEHLQVVGRWQCQETFEHHHVLPSWMGFLWTGF